MPGHRAFGSTSLHAPLDAVLVLELVDSRRFVAEGLPPSPRLSAENSEAAEPDLRIAIRLPDEQPRPAITPCRTPRTWQTARLASVLSVDDGHCELSRNWSKFSVPQTAMVPASRLGGAPMRSNCLRSRPNALRGECAQKSSGVRRSVTMADYSAVVAL
jgi:hypothetical protein